MTWRLHLETKGFQHFKTWLILFPTLNVVDVIQTWLFFKYEANPLYVLFPHVVFGVKVFWTFFAPWVLYISYRKRPALVYRVTLALILLYVGIVFVNTASIIRMIIA